MPACMSFLTARWCTRAFGLRCSPSCRSFLTARWRISIRNSLHAAETIWSLFFGMSPAYCSAFHFFCTASLTTSSLLFGLLLAYRSASPSCCTASLTTSSLSCSLLLAYRSVWPFFCTVVSAGTMAHQHSQAKPGFVCLF
jgi:hypothetical protein